MCRNGDGHPTRIPRQILEGKGSENFLSKYAFYDNRDGIFAPVYNLNNHNATDYSETGDKTRKILQHLKGLVIYTNICSTCIASNEL
jgi:hypothetical protein